MECYGKVTNDFLFDLETQGDETKVPMRRCWISSRNLCPGFGHPRSKASVAPTTTSNTSDYHNGIRSVKTQAKQVHFADDCGEPLECSIHDVISRRPFPGMFYESLEEAYINKYGIVRGFLNIANLEDSQRLVVLYTEDKWKSHKKSPAYRFGEEGYAKIVPKMPRENGSELTSQNDGKPIKYAFSFKTTKKKSINIELVVLSSLNGSVDHRHRQRYKLSKNFTKTAHRHCVIS